jgi:hypothetical protein
MTLLPMFEVLVLHYSNYRTKNKIITATTVYCGNTQMPYAENPLPQILIKGISIMDKDSNLMVHSLYCLINFHIVIEVLSSPNCELVFMREINIPLVNATGRMEPYRSVQWPTNFIKDRAVVPKHYMYSIKILKTPADNYDVQNITSYRVTNVRQNLCNIKPI